MQANDGNWRHKAASGWKSITEAASGLTRFQVAVMAALMLLLMAGAALSYARSRPSVVRVIPQGGASSSGNRAGGPGKADLAVHVAGAVNRPGLYHVPEGSRIADALDKAGGPTPDALLDNINLAAKVKDGDKVLVPRTGIASTGAQAASDEPSTAAGPSNQTININIAGVDELDTLPGVGPALARRIVEYRQKNGQFSSVDELDNVEGIGPAKLESLKDLVTI